MKSDLIVINKPTRNLSELRTQMTQKLTFKSLAVSLPTTRFNIQKILHGARFALSHLCGSENIKRFLCFVDRTALYNLVNRTSLVQNFS